MLSWLGGLFGSPWMLAWLPAVAAPILIHLWNRRKYRQVTWAAMEYLLAAVVKRARRDGGLRPDVEPLDVVWLIELFSRGRPGRPTAGSDNVRRRLLAIALDGLRAQGGPLPGSPPDLEFYLGRWRTGP